MDKIRIRIEIKDNYDKNFKKTIYEYIYEDDYKILKNYDSEDYDRVWDNLIELIEEIYTDLPYDWYIDTLIL